MKRWAPLWIIPIWITPYYRYDLFCPHDCCSYGTVRFNFKTKLIVNKIKTKLIINKILKINTAKDGVFYHCNYFTMRYIVLWFTIRWIRTDQVNPNVVHSFKIEKLLVEKEVHTYICTNFNCIFNINHSIPLGICVLYLYTSLNHLKQKQVNKKAQG